MNTSDLKASSGTGLGALLLGVIAGNWLQLGLLEIVALGSSLYLFGVQVYVMRWLGMVAPKREGL